MKFYNLLVDSCFALNSTCIYSNVILFDALAQFILLSNFFFLLFNRWFYFCPFFFRDFSYLYQTVYWIKRQVYHYFILLILKVYNIVKIYICIFCVSSRHFKLWSIYLGERHNNKEISETEHHDNPQFTG